MPPKPKATPKAGAKKAALAKTPAGPGALASGGLKCTFWYLIFAELKLIERILAASTSVNVDQGASKEVEQLQESFSATGIDDALDLLEVVQAKTDKASTGTAAANIERHPERRFKVCQLV